MADLSPAEIMLDSLVPAQRLIKRLQSVLKAPFPYEGIPLSPETKAARAALRDAIQRDIDELTAQREKVVALINCISDPVAKKVVLYHYQLIGSGREKMPYFKIGERMNYSDKTVLRYHQKGVDQLNQILVRGIA